MASADEYSSTDEPDYDSDYSPQGLEEAGAMQFGGDEEDDVENDGIVQGTRRRRGARSQAPTVPEESRPTRPARRKAPKRGRSPSVEVVLPDRTKRKKTSHPTPKSGGVAERSREEDSDYSSSPESTEGHVLWGLVRENLSKKMSTARVREYMDETLPILTKRQLDRLFPKKLPQSKYDEDWTRKDEKKLQRDWKKNAERELLVTFKYTPAELIGLWKVWLRVWRCSPQLFISKYNNMEFDTSVVDEIEIEKNGQVYKRRPAIWSVAFCRNLHHLSLHPVWMGSLDLLAIALQYASILRTRNYQDWPLDNPTDDNFLATFINVIEKYKGKGKSPPELHKKTRSRMTHKALNASPLSTLMLDLEGSILTDAEPRTNGRKFRTYKISIHEINNIIRALANSTYMGMPQWGGFTPKEYAKLAVYGRRPLSELPNKSNIADVYERAILVRLRWEAKNKKRRARLNVPKTEPFRVPSRHRAAREDETTGDAQLRADLDDAIRQKEALEAELRARPPIEKRRRRTADENAHLEELKAENKELRERLESEASEHAQMEEILKTDLEEAGRQIEAWKARVRAPSPR